MRFWLIVLIVVVCIVGLGALLAPTAIDRIRSQSTPEATVVRLELPRRGDLVEIVRAPGEVEPKTKVEISARVSARIVELPFEEGAFVTKGDPSANPPVPASVVLRLDDSDLRAALTAAEARRAADEAAVEVHKARIESQRAAIQSIQASLVQAEKDLARQRGLRETGDVAQSVLDTAQARYDELAANLAAQQSSLEADELNLVVMSHNLEVADAEIAQAREQLSYTTITSPIDGIITRLNAEVGELVITGTMNNPGTVIMEIADLNTMLLVAQVDEAAIGGVKVGQPAIVRINAYPDRVFNGVVETIALSNDVADDRSKYYKTEILLDTGGERIYSGLTADVEIETRRHEDVLLVPSQAVLARPVDGLPLAIRDNNPDVDMTKSLATVVYRFTDGKAVVTPVTVGASDIADTIVLSGLSEADQVVVGPYRVLETLAHDMAVKDERVAEEEKLAKQREEERKAAATQPQDDGEKGGEAGADAGAASDSDSSN